jgi:hypothetical protein
MKKIFNEKEYAEELLKHGFTKFMSGQDLYVLGIYYKNLGLNIDEIKNNLIEFCYKFNINFNYIIYSSFIESVLNKCKKYDLRKLVNIPVTEKELETIRNIKNYRYEKILFTLLVLSKYYVLTKKKIVKKNIGKSPEYFVNNKINEINKLAHTSVKREENPYHLFYENKLIIPNLRGGIKINFVNNESDTKIIVEDMNNIPSFYKPLCEDCGKVIEVKSKYHNKCADCYKDYRKGIINKNSKKYYDNN